MKTIEKIYNNQYCDVDLNARIFISSIINYFQDIFVDVSLAKGTEIGIEYMNLKNLTWIIYRWQLSVYKYVDCKDEIKVTMTPTAYKKSYMNVKFAMYSKQGEKLAEAFSLWILLDMKENRPYRGESEDENILKIFNLSRENNKIDTMKNVDILRKIETVDAVDNEKNFEVGYSDIDTNKHANNTRYISWVLEPIAQYLIEDYEVKEIKISYKKPAMYGDSVKAGCYLEENNNNVVSYNKITDKYGGIFAAAEISLEKVE